MDSGMVSKIDKARRYAKEKDRACFRTFEVDFHGDHDNYTVRYDNGTWTCQCHFFSQRGVCSHTMALERILEGMMPKAEHTAEPEVAS